MTAANLASLYYPALVPLLCGRLLLTAFPESQVALYAYPAALAGLLLVDGLLDGLEPAVLDSLEQCLAVQCNMMTVIVLTSDPTVARWCQRTITLPSPRSLAAAGAAAPMASDPSERWGSAP